MVLSRTSLGFVVAAACIQIGCAIPSTPSYTPNKGVGMKLCADLANRAQLISTQEFGIGVFLLTVGGTSLTASGVLATISANSEDHRQLLGYVGAGLAVAPLLAVPTGMVMLSRSDEASALAAASNTALALSETDLDAYRDCVLAKASWVGSRTDATALARQALEEQKEKDKENEEASEREAEDRPEPERDTPDEDARPGPRR